MHPSLTTQPIIPECRASEWIAEKGDSAELNGIAKERDRQEVLAKVSAMLSIEARVAEGMTIGKAVAQTATLWKGRKGFSRSRLNDYYQLWRKGGQKPNKQGIRSGQFYQSRDWHVFIPNYTNGDCDAALTNQELVKHVCRVQSDYCRGDVTGVAVHERITDDWWAGKTIPGLGNIRQHCAKLGKPVPQSRVKPRYPHWAYPDGLSPANLLRMIPRSAAKRQIVRRGEFAAHDHYALQLLRDRNRLMPLQLITPDDHPLDIEVLCPLPDGTVQRTQPQGLFMIDVRSGAIIAHGATPAYLRSNDADGGKRGTKRGLQRADMRFLLLQILERFGLPRDWKTLCLMERGGATLTTEDKEAFRTMLPQLSFEDTGLIKNSLLEHGFAQSDGMPWQKGWIESYFNLLENRLNALPGATARRYDLRKADHESRMRYALKIAGECIKQNIPLAEAKLPCLTWDEFMTSLNDYVIQLNNRTRHKLQGDFPKIMFVEDSSGNRYGQDHPQFDLMSREFPILWEQESPAHCFRRVLNGHQLDPIHPRQLATLSMHKRKVTVRADRVTLEISQLSSDKLVYWDEDTAEALAEHNGRKNALIAYVSSNGDQIHLFTNDEHKTHIGSPRRVGTVDLSNQSEILEAAGRVHQSRQALRDEAADLLEPVNQQHRQMREHNTSLLGNGQIEGQSRGARTPAPAHQITSQIDRAEADALSRKPQKAEVDARRERLRKLAALKEQDT